MNIYEKQFVKLTRSSFAQNETKILTSFSKQYFWHIILHRFCHQIREMSSNRRAFNHEEEDEKVNSPGSSTLQKNVRLDKEMSLQVSQKSNFYVITYIFNY